MKHLILGLITFSIISCGGAEESVETAGTTSACNPQTKIDMQTLEDEVSYSIGFSNCEEMKMQISQAKLEPFVILSAYFEGFSQVLKGEKTKITEEEANIQLGQYFIRGGMPDSNAVKPLDASYALGVQQANSTIRGLGKNGVWDKFNGTFIAVGFEDAFCSNTPQLPKEEIVPKVVEYMSRLNEIKGEQFLSENGKRPEVKTTESGLQYEILTPGSGPNPTEKNTAIVHYKGMLLDSTVFDQNDELSKPFEFSLAGGVIMGWLEGVKLMNKGAKYRFYIPHNLAYGAQGTPGGPIPPYSTLIFDVELLDFK
ncbi:MAG: FKBP-type peptidyl-prolyl cis-trans isomerase [Crocinitomicaceae bacterium]